MGDEVPDWNTKPRLRALLGLLGALPDPTTPLPRRERRPKTGRAKRLKEEQVAKLCQAYKAGATLQQLSDDFDIVPMTVSAILKRQGIKTRWRKLTEADVDEAERLYTQGMSLAKIGDRLGVTDCAVRYRLIKREVKMRGPHDRT
ncbi:helix-turn-helix domain-containing protein [Streptomyces sp. NPDC090083]|uniref:helix-turn-helix domain-containing protein n=1 Tax=Streptomyces sp. NPDC090083 TaxID=3365941 RepID=UPI00382CBCBA